MAEKFSRLVITFMIEYRRSFLLVRRVETEKNFPGYWAFPGGRVEVGETAIDTIRREVAEETGLKLRDRLILLDTYSFKYSTGISVLLQPLSQDIKPYPAEITEYAWVKSLSELNHYRRIPGIDNHLHSALAALKNPHWQKMSGLQLTQQKFLNR